MFKIRVFITVGVIFLMASLFISCDSSTDADTEPVWKITSDSTATWTGEEISFSGKFDYAFKKDSTDISINGHPNKGRVVVNAIYNPGFEEDANIADYLDMYSEPLNTDLLSLDKRRMPCSGDCNFSGFPFGGVVMNGDVNCDQPASQLDEFRIIYEDAEKVFVDIRFESKGMEDTIKKLVCK